MDVIVGRFCWSERVGHGCPVHYEMLLPKKIQVNYLVTRVK
jgi:hypothetical protein